MEKKSIAIVQSCYIPWKGYFDMIGQVDEFVLFDCVQFTKRDWRNRNQIKTASGPKWLTIPTNVKGRFTQKISETTVVSPDWAREHWKTICHSYARAPHFDDYREQFEELYLGCSETHLSRINYRMLSAICGILGIRTRLSWADEYATADGKNERLISICKQAGAAEYLSGAAAQSYIDMAQFASEGITVRWMNYDAYPEYPQLFPPFTHFVSVIDLIFNTGPDAPKFMKWTAS